MVLPFAGDVLTTHDGTDVDAVVKLVLLAAQPDAVPLAFFGAIYQLYNVEEVKPLAL